MKEILFRAWHNGKMIYNCPVYKTYDSPIMQYTGIKDENDNKIFEGDIVKVTILDRDSAMGRCDEYICEVCFGGGEHCGSFTLKNKKFYKGYALISFANYGEIEVVDNIHKVSD